MTAPASWKARQTRPGIDSISNMAMRYGFPPSTLREVIRKAGTKVVREDGYRGKLEQHRTTRPTGGFLTTTRVITGWDDGVVGVDLDKTFVTRKSIRAVSRWAFQKMYGDN